MMLFKQLREPSGSLDLLVPSGAWERADSSRDREGVGIRNDSRPLADGRGSNLLSRGATELHRQALVWCAAFIACVSLAQAEETRKPTLFDRVQIKNEVGGDALEFKGKSDGAKVVDLNERELFRINLKGSKLKIKHPDESVVAYIVVKPGEFKVLDPTEKHELFELQKQADGDWKLKDGSDKSLLRIKHRDYGFEIETQDGKSLFKSKLKDGKVSLRDANDKTVYSTKDASSTLAVSCLGFQPISELGVKAGLVAAVLWFDSPRP